MRRKPSEQNEDYDDEHAGLIEQLMRTEDVQGQVKILALMKARGFKPSGRAATGRFQRVPGGRGQAGAGPRAGAGLW